jgi:CRP/FNR family transcriptional regulator, cyclic AMP receptor protein
MGKKSSPSMIHRYTGRDGKVRLIDLLCSQPIVAGDRAIARELVQSGGVIDVKNGESIITQGAADNDMFLIVSGKVSVIINGREIAVRTANSYVGEMSLLDGTARRSATVIARERTIVVKLSERAVTRIATKVPDVWRRMAIELAARLRARSQFIAQPNTEPSVFIGSSSEALAEATFISESLRSRQFFTRLWTQGVFQLSRTTLEDLLAVANSIDFAVLLITSDDTTVSRGKKKPSPRDNIVFELGLFMGALGRERAFIVNLNDADLKLPTDILGITTVPYIMGAKVTMKKRLQPVVNAIISAIEKKGPK